MDNQDYTSKLLCHFVGRSKSNDDERYDLLIKIIKQDLALFANPDNPDKPLAGLTAKYDGSNFGEMLSRCDCVCFCDIPESSLSIHRHKYSSFGMGFEKAFLVAQGTRPVMYIPKGLRMTGYMMENETTTPEDYYITFERKISNLVPLLVARRIIRATKCKLFFHETAL